MGNGFFGDSVSKTPLPWKRLESPLQRSESPGDGRGLGADDVVLVDERSVPALGLEIGERVAQVALGLREAGGAAGETVQLGDVHGLLRPEK